MHIFDVEGAVFRVGENAEENHEMTGKASKKTWFFHASHVPSPHGILDIAEVPTQSMAMKCASIIRHYTSPTSTIHVDMISRRYVRLGERLGEVEFLRGPRSVWKC